MMMNEPHQRRSVANIAILCAWAAVLLVGGSVASAASYDIKVMSFNVRVGSADDGVNSWNNPNAGVDRKDLVVQTVANYNPDILGLQEDLDYQGNYIKNNTTGYSMFRRGVRADGTGEQVGILYKTSRFTKLRQGSFWLSPDPETPGSEFGSAEFPRIVNWLELRDKENPNYSFVVMNTHFEHGGADAKNTVRLKSAALFREKMLEIAPNLPIIFTGDFNADEGSEPYLRMTSRDDFVETPVDETRFLTDTYRNKHSDSGTVGTAPGFDGTAGSNRIDWILHTDTGFDTIAADINRVNYSGRYPSDHFSINATIRPTQTPEPVGAALLGIGAFGLMLRRRERNTAV